KRTDLNIEVGIRAGNVFSDGAHDDLRALDGCAGLQTRDHLVRQTETTFFGKFTLCESHRHPEFNVGVELLDVFRRDADDLIIVALELNRAVENRRVRTVESLPQRCAQHHDALVAGAIFFGSEEAARNRIDTESRKESCGNAACLQTLGQTHTSQIEVASDQSSG